MLKRLLNIYDSEPGQPSGTKGKAEGIPQVNLERAVFTDDVLQEKHLSDTKSLKSTHGKSEDALRRSSEKAQVLIPLMRSYTNSRYIDKNMMKQNRQSLLASRLDHLRQQSSQASNSN